MAEQKKKKPNINEAAKNLYSEKFLTDIEQFIEFCKQNKISTPSVSVNRFNMAHKGIIAGRLYFENDNRIVIEITLADRNEYDDYLDGKSKDIFNDFMEQKARRCPGPNMGCCSCENSFGSGIVTIMGNQYSKMCLRRGYRFTTYNMNDFILDTDTVCQVPLDSIKNLILARIEHIKKDLLAKK